MSHANTELSFPASPYSRPAGDPAALQVSIADDHPLHANLMISELRLRERGHHVSLCNEIGEVLNRDGANSAMLDECLRILTDHLPVSVAGVCLLGESDNPSLLRIHASLHCDRDHTLEFLHRESFEQEALVDEGPQLAVKHSSVIASEELAAWANERDLPIFAKCPLFNGSRKIGVLFLFSERHLTEATERAIRAACDQLSTGIAKKRAVEALRFTQFTIDRLATAVLWLSQEGCILKANQSACELTGYKLEELLRLKAPQLLWRPKELPWSGVWKRLCGRSQISLECFVRRRTGEPIAVAIAGNVFHFEGKPYFCAMLTDITDRKLVEKKLRQSKRELKSALGKLQLQVQCLPLAYMLLDKKLQIVDWNPCAEQLFGFCLAEVGGSRPFEHAMTSDANRDDFRSALRAASENAHSRLTVMHESKSKARLICDWTIAPFCSPQGVVEGILCVGRDITQQIQLEEQCKRSQRLEAIGRFSAGIAHDFNNFLTIIMGFADVIDDNAREDASLRNCVSEIKKAGERSRQLIRQLMTFSRQESSAPQIVSLNQVITEMKPLLEQLMGSHMGLSLDLGDEVRSVYIDPSKLEQVLLNLVGNARDAMQCRGELRITTSSMNWSTAKDFAPSAAKPASWTVLSVADQGCGMSPVTRQRIFEPFFTTKEPGRGSGLGLAVVYGIVSQSGGYLDVATEVDRGTTVTIYLPGCEPEHSPREGIRESDRRDAADHEPTKCIVLVDPEDATRAMLAASLATFGFRVMETQSLAEAIARVDNYKQPIDLILTRVTPAIGDVRELLRHARAQGDATRILFTSGHLEEELRENGILPRGIDFLQKPFTSSELFRKVNQVLTRPRSGVDGVQDPWGALTE